MAAMLTSDFAAIPSSKFRNDDDNNGGGAGGAYLDLTHSEINKNNILQPLLMPPDMHYAPADIPFSPPYKNAQMQRDLPNDMFVRYYYIGLAVVGMFLLFRMVEKS
jgi:hypothetical protein